MFDVFYFFILTLYFTTYNSEYIVATDIFQDRNDVWTLVPFLKNIEEKLGFRYPSVTADSGYESEGCSKCPYREKCAKTRENKQLYVSKGFIEKRDESYQNILSETGIKYRMNRSIQVGGAFGVLKNDYNFKRFLLRGKTKVKIEILLLCLGYNINKLHSKIQGKRTQSYLFQLQQA